MKLSDLLQPMVTKRGRRRKHYNGLPMAVVQSGTGDDTVSYGAGITGVSENKLQPNDDDALVLKLKSPKGGFHPWNEFRDFMDEAFGGPRDWTVEHVPIAGLEGTTEIKIRDTAKIDYKKLKEFGYDIDFSISLGDDDAD